jgi:hypothetical protein
MSSNQYGTTTDVVRQSSGIAEQAVPASGASVVRRLDTLNRTPADVPSDRPAALRAAGLQSGTEDAGPIPAGPRLGLGMIP